MPEYRSEKKSEHKSGLRILPLLLAVGSIAAVSRVADVYAGVSVLAGSAVAEGLSAQDDNKPQDKPVEQKPGDDADKKKKDTADKNTSKAEDKAAQAPDSMAPTNELLNLRSEEEMRIVEQIKRRSRELDARSEKLDLREKLLDSQEIRLQEKIDELKKLQGLILAHLKKFDALENEQLKVVIEIYGKMKPKEAAPIFQNLDLQTQLALATRMPSKKIALIMAKMDAAKATELSKQLATVVAAPTLDDIQNENNAR